MRNSVVLSLPVLILSIQQRCIRFLPAPRPWGLTKRYIGSWLANIEAALDSSLQRLGTDYIDIYQLYWPDREINNFGKPGYNHTGEEGVVPIQETLGLLREI